MGARDSQASLDRPSYLESVLPGRKHLSDMISHSSKVLGDFKKKQDLIG